MTRYFNDCIDLRIINSLYEKVSSRLNQSLLYKLNNCILHENRYIKLVISLNEHVTFQWNNLPMGPVMVILGPDILRSWTSPEKRSGQ